MYVKDKSALTLSVGGLLLLPLNTNSVFCCKIKESKWAKYNWAASPSIPLSRDKSLVSLTIGSAFASLFDASFIFSTGTRKEWSLVALSKTHLALYIFPNMNCRAYLQLSSSSSDIKCCFFLKRTLPRSTPIVRAKNFPVGVKKHKSMPLEAHAPIRAGLAPA